MTDRRILTVFDGSTAPFDRAVDRIDKRLARWERGTSKRLDRFDRRFEQSARAVRALGDVVKVALGGASLAAARQYAENWRLVGRQIEAAGFKGDAAKKKLVDLSITLGQSVQKVGLAVKQFARASGKDLDGAARDVETLLKGANIGGASQSQIDSLFLQLPQALQLGRLQGNDFKSFVQNAPPEILDAIAAPLGATRNQLQQLSQEGKITNDVIFAGLADAAEVIDEKFSHLERTGDQAFKTLDTGLTAFIGSIDQSLGATETFNQAISNIGEFLAENTEAAEAFAHALQLAAEAAVGIGAARGLTGIAAVLQAQAAARANLVRRLTEEVAARQTVVASMRAQGVAAATLAAAEREAAIAAGQLTAAQARLSLATRVSTAAVGALRNALAFFGGPIGLAITAATVGVFELSRHLSEAEVEAVDLESATRDLEQASQDYAAAIASSAKAQTDATATILAETKREYEAKKKLLELEVERRRAALPERQAEVAELQARLRRHRANIESRNAFDLDGVPIDASAEFRDAERRIEQASAELELERLAIERAEQALTKAFGDTSRGAGGAGAGSGGGGSGSRLDPAASRGASRRSSPRRRISTAGARRRACSRTCAAARSAWPMSSASWRRSARCWCG